MSAQSRPFPVAQTTPGTDGARDQGRIVRVAGSVVGICGLRRARLYDVVLIGPGRLAGEIIRLAGDTAVAQVYEPTNGLRVGNPVAGTGRPLSVELGPGLLGGIIDGTARPLAALAGQAADAGGRDAEPFLARGVNLPTLDRTRRFEFRPAVAAGQQVAPGDALGRVAESGGHDHLVLVPPGVSGTVTGVRPGRATVTDTVAEIDGKPVPMLRHWAVRQPRPVGGRLDATRPLITGQRVIDTLFPVARAARPPSPAASAPARQSSSSRSPNTSATRAATSRCWPTAPAGGGKRCGRYQAGCRRCPPKRAIPPTWPAGSQLRRDFEQRFIGQGARRRGLTETLDLAWALLGRFPRHELTRIRESHLHRHHPGQIRQGPAENNPP